MTVVFNESSSSWEETILVRSSKSLSLLPFSTLLLPYGLLRFSYCSNVFLSSVIDPLVDLSVAKTQTFCQLLDPIGAPVHTRLILLLEDDFLLVCESVARNSSSLLLYGPSLVHAYCWRDIIFDSDLRGFD